MKHWIRSYEGAFDAEICSRLRALMPLAARLDFDYQRCDKLDLAQSAFDLLVGKQLAKVFERYKSDVEHNGNLNFCTHVELPSILCYRHETNDHFHMHADNWSPESALRQVSIIVFLNTVKEGGTVVFPGCDLCIVPTEGWALVFPSFFTFSHVAWRPVSEDKYALVTWYCYEPRTKGHYAVVPAAKLDP